MNRERHAINLVRPRSSFTLIEVVLALALTTLVMTLTGRIAIQTLTTRQSVEGVVHRMQRERVLFDRLSRDIGAVLYDIPGRDPPLILFGTNRPVLQLSNVLAALPDTGDSLHLIHRPAMVRYRLREDRSRSAGHSLIRETIDRTDAAATPMRETVVTSVKALEIEVLAKGKWTRRFPTRRQEQIPAEALRIRCLWADTDNVSTRVFMLSHVARAPHAK